MWLKSLTSGTFRLLFTYFWKKSYVVGTHWKHFNPKEDFNEYLSKRFVVEKKEKFTGTNDHCIN